MSLVLASSDYTLSKARPKDAKTLSQIWRATFTEAYVDVHSAENIDKYCLENFSIMKARLELECPSVTCKFLVKNNIAVGFYLLKDVACPMNVVGASAELKQIYVLSEYYGKGLGALLYQDAVMTLRKSAKQVVWLSVSDLNTRAKAFYKKIGFEAAGVGPVFEVGFDRLTSTILVCSL